MPQRKTYSNRIKKGATRGSALGAPGASVGMAGAVIKNALERNKRSQASKLGWHRKKDLGQRKKKMEAEIEAEVGNIIQEMGSGKDIKAGMKKGAKTGARSGAIAGASLGAVAGGLIAGAPGAALGGLTGAGVGSATGSIAGSVVGAAKGAFKRRSTEEEIQAEIRNIIAEADGVDEGMLDRVKKGAIRGARQGAYNGMYASDSATMSFGPTTGALVHGAHVVAGGLTGAARAAFSKDDEDEMDDLDQQDESLQEGERWDNIKAGAKSGAETAAAPLDTKKARRLAWAGAGLGGSNMLSAARNGARIGGAIGGAVKGALKKTSKKTTEAEIAEEIAEIIEGERWNNIKKGAKTGAKRGAVIGGAAGLGAGLGAASTSDVAAGTGFGAAFGGAAGAAIGGIAGALKKTKKKKHEGYIESFLGETTGMYAVGTAPIPGFVPGGDKVKIKDMGDGKFSIVVLEDGSEIEVDSGLSGDEAKDLATEYAQMFTSGSYVESSDVETRKENKMISTKKLIEAVARGADPKAAVAQFLRSKLTEDTDVATMLPATDTQAGELPGVDVEDPEDDAAMDAEIGPGSPIVPMADQTPVDAAVPSTELGTKEGEAAVDAAVSAADSAEKDDEFMEGKSPAFKRRVRESLARIVEEEGGGMPPEIQAKLDAKDDEEGGEEGGEEEGGEEEKGEEGSEEKKEARARRIRARIREARRRRLAKIREEEGDEECDDEEDGEEMEEARSNFRTTQRNESDAIHRGRNRRATTGQRFESVASIFTQTVREQEEGTPEPPGSEMLPDEGDEEVILAPVENRRRKSSLRARLEARRRARRRISEEEGDDDKEAVNFPPSQYRQEEPAEPGDEVSDDEGEEFKEGLISDLTKGDVDDEEDTPVRIPESISRRRAKFLEARRRARRRLKEHINPMLQPGMKVVERSSGKRGRIVDNEIYAKGGHQYMVAFFDESRTRRVRHDDIDKA